MAPPRLGFVPPPRRWEQGRTTRPAGCLPSLSLANPAFSFAFCPHPPNPLPSGKGEPQSLFRRGLRPRHPDTEPPTALTDPSKQAPRRAPPTQVEPVPRPIQPRGCKGRSPLHKKTKSLPLPAGKGVGGWGQKSKLKAGAAGGKEGQPPARHRQRRSSQCRAPSSPGDARGEAPCIRKLKVSPFPPGSGGGGMGAVNQAKGRGDRRQRGQAPPVDSGMARSAGDQPGKPPAGCEICFLLRRLKINPVAVAFFEKPLAFLRKIWYNTIQSCTVACSCARKPARV